jgi:diguanylate cyclase (GGDEF)-like protein
MRRLEAQSKAMMDLAMHDQLTVLYNRHYLRENVPGRFTESDRTGRSISLTIIDINHFKQVNDTYGHDMGDNVLVAFANSLKAHIAEDDLLARVGGEEFVLLAFGHLEQTVDRAKHLRKVISELKPCGLKITASFGVAARAPTEKYESLFKRADSAVYNAKEDGRDRVKFVS